MENNTNETEAAPKQSFIWDSERKKPSQYFFFLIIAITILFIIWGIFDLLTETHEIKFEVDYNGNWDAEIAIDDTDEYIEGFGYKEFAYRAIEGTFITITIYLSDPNSEYLNVNIYDDGNLVRSGAWLDSIDTIFLEYTVGEV